MDEIVITIRNSQDHKYAEVARDIRKLPEEKQIEILYDFCCFEFRLKYGVDYEARKRNIKYMDVWSIYNSMFEEVVKETVRKIKQYL